MNQRVLWSTSTLSLLLGLVVAASPAAADSLKLEVVGLGKGKKIVDKNVFNGMGCTGENVSPELKWSGAPKETKAFAVTVFDPDAPTGSGFWHWVVYNLPGDATGLPEGAGSGKAKLPAGAVEGRTDFGKSGYGGPCPPPGKPHHYVFKVYALKETLQPPPEPTAAMVGFFIHQAKLAEASVTGTYGR